MIEIDIESLYDGENILEFEAEDLQTVDFGTLQVVQTNSLQLTVTARGSYLYVTGANPIDLKFDCDRCAEEFGRRYRVELEYVFHLGDLGEGDTADVEVLDENEKKINFDPYYQESVQIAVPFLQLCSQKCKGLCAKCGTNLNEDGCDCSKSKPIDPRWEKLAEIARKMKEEEEKQK